MEAFDVLEPVERLIIDVHAAHFWDISAIGALDRAVSRARRLARLVEVVGLNEASATMVAHLRQLRCRFTERSSVSGSGADLLLGWVTDRPLPDSSLDLRRLHGIVVFVAMPAPRLDIEYQVGQGRAPRRSSMAQVVGGEDVMACLFGQSRR